MLFPITGYEVLIALSFLIILFYPMVFQHYFWDSKNHQQVDFNVFWSSQGLWIILIFSLNAYVFWVHTSEFLVSKNNSYFPILQSFQFNSVKLRPLTKDSSSFSCWFHVNKGTFFLKKKHITLNFLWYIYDIFCLREIQ